ncbi:MAG: outer membrane lipoprotein carrier protein LolA [Prosthecobacter sp.]|nr:outer membrane lipoprotein carrier protein LolA [Prosthecobacter sp.]
MRFFLTTLMALCALGAAFPQAATLPRPNDPLPPIMLEWAAAQRKVGDIQVGFKQTRTVPALKAPVVSEGKFWRFTDGAFRWQLGQPPVTVLVHDANEFRVQEKPGAPWVALDEKDGRYRMWSQFLSGRDASPEDLTRNFTVKVIANEKEAVTVGMVPKPLVIRRYLKQVQLQITPGSMRLRQLRVIQGDGATVTMQFFEPKSVAAAEKTRLLAR